MEGSPIVRERPRKTIGQTIKKVLDLNGLYLSMIYDRILWCHLILVVNLTYWEMASIVVVAA